MPLCLPETFKIVQLASPETTNGGKTSDAVSLRDCLMAWLIIDVTNAVGHATTFTPMQATDVAIGTNAVLPAMPIWSNLAPAVTDTLVARTAAANYAVDAAATDKQIIFQIDPAILTAGYDCIYCIAADSSQATDFWNCTAVLQNRYPQATPPSAIID